MRILQLNGLREHDVLKGLAAGVVSGLAAAWVMNQFQALWGKLTEGAERPHGAQSLQQGSPEHGIGRELKERGSDDGEDNAAVRTANAVAELFFNHKLNHSEKVFGWEIAHYDMRTISSANYGFASQFVSDAKVGLGR